MRSRALLLFFLALIAVILAVDFTLDHVRPTLALAMNRTTYLEASADCHEARSYALQATATAGARDDEQATALRRTARVAILACQPRGLLREQLLAAGVSTHALDGLDVEAGLVSTSFLPYVGAAP